MLFDLTANSNSRKIMALNPSYPQDVTKTVIKGNAVSATFKVVVSEPGRPDAYTYQWYVNGTAVSGANGSTYTRTDLTSTATYTVYCIVSNKAGSVKSRVATLKVTQYYTPVLNSSYPQNATVVKGTSVKSEVKISTAGNPASYTYQWYKNGSAVSGATGSSYNFTPAAEGTTTVYCKVTNSAGTVTSRTATITATKMYLYNAGDQCEEATGGWTSTGYKHQTWGCSSTFNADNIHIALVSGQSAGGVGTVNKVDLSGYSTLKAVVYPEYQFSMYLSVLNDKGADIKDGTAMARLEVPYATDGVKKTVSIDISSLSSGYIAFGTSSKATIYSVWLE